jgi:hypothetical protein
VTATKSWGPTLTETVGREVDYQVAAPTETRTPTLHRANIAHQRVRMEGWRQGRLGSRAETHREKEKDKNILTGKKGKTYLTLTGLLMEGFDRMVAKHRPEDSRRSKAARTAQYRAQTRYALFQPAVLCGVCLR